MNHRKLWVDQAIKPGAAPATADERHRTGLVGPVLIGVCLVGLCLANHACRSSKRKGAGDMVVAMNNAKSLVLALNDFSTEYGSFPDQETAKAVKEQTKTPLDLSGDTANDYFRQLIAAGVVKSENPFYAKTPYSFRNPDNNMTGSQALAPGEVGFGYVMNGAKALPNDDPNRIVAAAPLLNATATGEFDPEPFQGKAALVYLDCSVKMVVIRETDHQVVIPPGKTLLETGPGTIWGTTITPVIKPPQLPPGWVPIAPRLKTLKWWWLMGAGATFTLLALWVVFKRQGPAGPPER